MKGYFLQILGFILFTSVKSSSRVDKASACPTWARNGECTKNPAYMIKNCAKSCGRLNQIACPTSHPYAYLHGDYCCRTNREKYNKKDGAGCDYSLLSPSSKCCAGDQFVKCRSTPCKNGQASASSSALAVDKHPSCGWWSKNDECTKNRAYMSRNCAKSCAAGVNKPKPTQKPKPKPTTGSNKDHKNCGFWQKQGNCKKDEFFKFMIEKCPVTCNAEFQARKCPVQASSAVCSDKSKSCRSWSSKGYCTNKKYKNFMSKNCGKSCKVCKKTGACGDTRRDCFIRAGRGHCASKQEKKYMDKNCRCTCRTCSPAKPKPTAPPATVAPTVSGKIYKLNPLYCGVKLRARIVGGEDADKGEWPWMALLMHTTGRSCGATILNEKYALTAAHCTDMWGTPKPGDYSLIIGTTDRRQKEPYQKKVKIDRIQGHENFDSRTYENDIALLTLTEEISFNQDVRPMCMPVYGERPALISKCVVTGWGYTEEMGKVASVLQKVNLPLVSLPVCKSVMDNFLTVKETNVCAGLAAGGKDSCQGDSGGPLQCMQNGRYVQVGIVSIGFGCARKGTYGVYTKVSSYRKWIESKMN